MRVTDMFIPQEVILVETGSNGDYGYRVVIAPELENYQTFQDRSWHLGVARGPNALNNILKTLKAANLDDQRWLYNPSRKRLELYKSAIESACKVDD